VTEARTPSPGWFRRALQSGVVIASTGPEHADELERLQEIVFPTLSPEERFRAPHYRKHLELFPEGQFVALDGARVVGMTTTIRVDDATAMRPHTFAAIIQGGWLTSHDPRGTWLYGADIGTHPDQRRSGVARGLYAARQETVRALGLAGQVTVGMLRGYGAEKHRISAEDYYAGVVTGRITDPTISTQMRIGFEPRGLLHGYISDPVCDCYGVLLVLRAGTDVPAAWVD